jgi:hypothetical protein
MRRIKLHEAEEVKWKVSISSQLHILGTSFLLH